MRQREASEQRASPLEGRQAGRKPYRKPTVRYERVFETSALTCGKTGSQGQCLKSKKTS